MSTSRRNFLRILSSTIVLAAMLIWTTRAHPDRIGPRIVPYSETIEESDLVIIGRTLDGKSIQVKDEEGPPPKPGTEKIGMVPNTIMPMHSSWSRSDLLEPPKIWAHQAGIEVIGHFKGNVDKDSEVAANLAYATSRQGVESFAGFERSRQYCSRGSIAVFHLKRIADEQGGDVYELVTEPWPVDKDKLGEMTGSMKVRFERYAALRKIDEYLDDFDSLDDAQKSDFLALISSSKPAMGKPVYLPGEKEKLERLIERTKKGAATSEEWREYWRITKLSYVVMPFVEIGNSGNSEDQGKEER